MNKLILAPFDCMRKLDQEGRGACPECKGKRKYYCYDCVVPLNQDPTELPRLKLPVDVTVVRHPKEKRSKSSIISSHIIAPDNIEILHTVEVPEQ
jgi:predicted amidophosphoribosyltransferase